MEEWERITKKEFINELSNRENALLGSWMNLKEDSPMTIKLVNALFEFDSGSWLYFNSISKCYRHNNILITIKERYDNWNEFHVCDIMGYWIGDKIE
jgi:hypothetical protein